jgi:ABC-2 type transport system ATP-binding protein
VLGKEVKGDNPLSRQNVGFMPELPRLPKHLKATELLDVYGRMYGMSEQRRRAEIPRLIELVGLKGRERDLIGKYSKGMQQRMGIAQALLGEPELVILDEPSIGLDPVGMVEVRELMKGIAKEGRTVFLSSHLLFEVEQTCNNVTIIHHGKILASDTLANVSGMLHGKPGLRIEVSNLSAGIVNAVKALPVVSNVTTDQNKISVDLNTTSDVRAQVSREIGRLGGIIVSMSTSTQSLEEVFVQLVSKSDEGGDPRRA